MTRDSHSVTWDGNKNKVIAIVLLFSRVSRSPMLRTTERYLYLSKKQFVNIVRPFDDLWKKKNRLVEWIVLTTIQNV